VAVDSAGHSRPDVPSGDDAGASEAPPSAPTPRLVRRVVCGYRIDSLPGAWLQTWRRLDRLLQREGFKVTATLAPLEDLPEDTGVLVVPPELSEAARAAVPSGTPVLVTSPEAATAAFADLVKRLEAEIELTAERVDPAEPAGPKIVTYRGATRLD
jgi:hypothetical protein